MRHASTKTTCCVSLTFFRDLCELRCVLFGLNNVLKDPCRYREKQDPSSAPFWSLGSVRLLYLYRNETVSRSIALNMFLTTLATIYNLMCVNLLIGGVSTDIKSLPETSDAIPNAEIDANFIWVFESEERNFFNTGSFQPLSIWRMVDHDPLVPHPWFDHRLSVCGHMFFSHRPSDFYLSLRQTCLTISDTEDESEENVFDSAAVYAFDGSHRWWKFSNVLGVEDNGPAKQMTLPYKENSQQPP
ncbi:hypothetical protein F2Q70_00018257 [Brassica cretica]|uniref:Uncharacterized protein n=1 Tax=Brassica cretica TaxID=69181 RepID=A0A8S9HQW4_BRACR|nr:hypothetical protein F2Q70_00018257 [Brassica cretica]